MKQLFISAIIFLQAGGLLAQLPEVGFWRDHLPFSKVIGVVQDDNLIYAATPHSVFTYNIQDQSIEKLMKGISLSDIGINCMSYNADQHTVVIGYSNGNIDLIKGNQTTNISSIKNSSIVGDKGVYGIHCVDQWAYLALGFGIVKLDLSRNEVNDTYIIGDGGNYAKVNDVATDDNKIYAAMENGIKEADLSNPFLVDYTQWSNRTDLPHAGMNISHIELFEEKLFIADRNSLFNDDSLFAFNGAIWEIDNSESGQDIFSLRVETGKLVVSHRSSVAILNGLNDQLENLYNFGGNFFNSFDAYYDGTTTWIGSERKGLIKAVGNWDTQSIYPQGPLFSESYSMNFVENDLWITAGQLQGSLGVNGYNRNGFCKFAGDYWVTFNENTNSSSVFDSTDAFDYTYVAVDPSNPEHIFVSSSSVLGLMEMTGGEINNLFNKTNSSIEQRTGTTNLYDLSECHFDIDGNLWVTSSRSPSPLSMKSPDGTWKSYSCTSLLPTDRISNSVMDDNGTIWATVPRKGIWAYKTNLTPTDENDDECQVLTTTVGNGALPVANVNCVALDLDGELWIGTEAGPAVIYSPSNVFGGGNYDAQQILIEQDGNVQILLETESITTIEIDGANRKWIGTQNSGAFLISEDGTTQVLHFNEENSPLPSNEIKDIEINGALGEVFFGTSKGVFSYRGSATAGGEFFSEVYAYPNPVRPEFDGTIAIKGLLRDSDVKITDVSGNLVFETTSYGGQALWNGRTFDDQKVSSGIYLVFASSEDGSLAVVTKIAIIN
ncbi:MAG: hypothetical protein HON99_09635 [Crocinitomicaceae bacterium]|nr:hypothetical protein [Crocinitomicaceae bacterium]